MGAARCGPSNSACAAPPAPRYWAGRCRPMRRRCGGCRSRPTVATAWASPSAMRSTRPIPRRRRCGWNTSRRARAAGPGANGAAPTRPPAASSCPEAAVRSACIALPRLALDAVLRRVPDPSRPLALVSGPAQLRHLHAVNAAAAEAGLKAGMRLSAAHALLADVAMVDHDPASEARWQRFLAAWAYRHSSQVSAQWAGAIVLEVRASFRLFGPWPRFEAR